LKFENSNNGEFLHIMYSHLSLIMIIFLIFSSSFGCRSKTNITHTNEKRCETNMLEKKIKKELPILASLSVQQYLDSDKGVMDFGKGTIVGNFYPIFEDNFVQKLWVAEVKKEELFVGAVHCSINMDSFLSAVFPKPQEYFWKPDQRKVESKFKDKHPNARIIITLIISKKYGYFWVIEGIEKGGKVQEWYHTSYCN